MKINPAITLCLLKVGKFHKYKKNQLIYTAFNHRKSFFIILKGKVKLLNLECETLKLCYPGETIAEQIVFEEAHKKKSMQHATACMSTYLLEMT